jgi:orotate phosphoribosyltransferase
MFVFVDLDVLLFESVSSCCVLLFTFIEHKAEKANFDVVFGPAYKGISLGAVVQRIVQ